VGRVSVSPRKQSAAQKEMHTIPKLNRMPDGPLGVKEDTSNSGGAGEMGKNMGALQKERDL
jgi:hypothetical protein